MKHHFALILLVFLFFSCIFSQTPPRDSIISHKSIKEDIDELGEKMKLSDITQSKNEFHFRFWSDRHMIEIWSEDTITFYGTIISFAREYNPMKWHDPSVWPHIKNYKPRFLHHLKMDIDTLKAKKVYELLKRSKVIFIVNSEKFKAGYMHLDGECYELEYADPHRYILKSYQMPISKQKKHWRFRIKRVYQILENELGLNEAFEDFKQTLPAGQYNYHGFGTFKILKKTE